MSLASSKTPSSPEENYKDKVREILQEQDSHEQDDDSSGVSAAHEHEHDATTTSAINNNHNSSTAKHATPTTLDIPQPHPFEHRFVQNADFASAPFTTPHYISLSRSAPFPGLHTVIEILFGPNLGSLIHPPLDLSTAEMELPERAIFWLWNESKSDTSFATLEDATKIMPTPSTTPSTHLIGPPSVSYPLTESTSPP
jgi:hypothetical protein